MKRHINQIADLLLCRMQGSKLATNAYATGFLVVRLKIHVQSHLCAVKPKAQCD